MAGIRRHKGHPEGPPDASADLLRAITERDEARRKRVFDRMYHAAENGRRELDGLDPLPTPPELAETKDDVLHTLRHVIPRYRQSLGYQHGEGKEFLDDWQNSALEKLNELDNKGDGE